MAAEAELKTASQGGIMLHNGARGSAVEDAISAINRGMSRNHDNDRPTRLRAGVSAAAIGFALAASSWAQTAPAEEGLEEVVVTAQKRPEKLQKVPISVVAVSGERIAEQSISGLEGLSKAVPTLQVSSGGLSEQIFIRGIGSGSNQGFEQSTGIYLDGIYFGIARLSRLAFLDVERVEVLKGPQSTLFGKSTIAGALNIASARPKFDFGYGLETRYQFEGGTEGAVDAYVTGPVSDTVAVRIAMSASAGEGGFYNTYLDRNQPRNEQYAGRVSLLAQPSDRFEILATLQGSFNQGNGRSQQIANLDTRFARVVSFRDQMLARDPRAEFVIDDRRSAGLIGFPSREDGSDQAVVGTLNASYDLGGVTLKSVTGYVDAQWREEIDSDASNIQIIETLLSQDIKQFSQEVRLESNDDGPIQYIAGLYYQSNEIDVPLSASLYNLAVIGSSTALRSCSSSQRDESNWGVFGQATWSVTDALRVTGGARYQEAQREIAMHRHIAGINSCDQAPTPAQTAAAAATFGQVNFDARDESGDSYVTPTATIEYDLFEGGMAYVTYRTGFKSGGFDLSAGRFVPATFQYAPEKASSWEAGVKMQFLGNKARLNINVFDTTFEDLQVSSFNGTGFTVGNAAEARSRGVEIQAEALLAPGLTTTLDLTYLNAKYEDFPGAQCYANQATIGTGCVANQQNLGGHVLPYSPKWSAALRFNYETDLTDTLEGFIQATVTYRTKQEVGPDGDPNRVVPEATKLDLRLGVGEIDGNWEVALLGKNLTDEMTASFGFNVPLITGAYVFQVDPPRTLAMQVRLKF